MAIITREQVAVAVFNLVTTAVNGANIGFVRSARRFALPSQVDPAQMPALFQIQIPEDYERTEGKMIALEPRRTMNFEIALYVSDPQEDSVIPSTQLNVMIDAIEAALLPDRTTNKQTLGDLVASARIEGKIDYDENLAGDGKSLAVVHIAVLRP